MNIKDAASKVMFKIFLWISIIGFIILGCTVDIAAEGLKTYAYLVLGWFMCVGITTLLYDYRIITRQLYAMCCSLMLLHGYLHKNRSPKYQLLYAMAIDAGNFTEFYSYALYLYDFNHPRKVN